MYDLMTTMYFGTSEFGGSLHVDMELQSEQGSSI
jgi:hypothetical protein